MRPRLDLAIRALLIPVALVLSIAVLAGCVPEPPPRVPHPELIPPAGEPWVAWNEVTMDHVVVRSPTPMERTRRLAADVEQTITALRDVGFPNAEARGRLLVVVFDSRSEYKRFADPNTVGLFMPSPNGDLDGRPIAFICACRASSLERGVIQHELTHYLISQAYGAVPRWVGEGLAQYYATLLVGGGYAFVGATDNERGVTEQSFAHREVGGRRLLVPLAELPLPSEYALGAIHLRPPTTDPRLAPQAAYLSTFVFTHLLMSGPVEDYQVRFARYLTLLQHGTASDRAFATAFAGVDADDLDEAFRTHARADHFMVRRTPYHPTTPAVVAARGLTPAAIASMFAKMEIPLGRARLAALALDRAISAGQEDAEVLAWKALTEAAEQRWSEAELYVARARTLAPRDPRPLVAAITVAVRRWQVRQSTLGGADASAPRSMDEEKLKELLKQLEPLARTPFELAMVSMLQLTDGRDEAALATSRNAFEADRACRACATAYAAALEKIHRYEEAVDIEERVVNLSGHVRDQRAASRLAALRKRLGRPAAPEPPVFASDLPGSRPSEPSQPVVPPFSPGNVPTKVGR